MSYKEPQPDLHINIAIHANHVFALDTEMQCSLLRRINIDGYMNQLNSTRKKESRHLKIGRNHQLR